jgi:hypothetical protein
MLCPAIDIPAVIRFLRAKNMSAEEIHRELRAVYCRNVVGERTVRQWCRMLKNGRPNKV